MTEQEFALRAQDQRGRLYRTAFLYLGGEHAAVDAVDEAVYRAFRDRRKLRQPEFFETWLTRILINVCKDELRRRRRECRVCVPPEPEAEHMDALSLREAVRALPEELRSVIVLRYFTGLTLEETAAALEIPRGTVSSRQRRAGVCAAFVVMVNASPAFAISCAKVPVLRELAAAVAFSPSLRAAVEHDYVQYIGRTEGADRISVTAEYVIASPARAHLFYSVEGGGRVSWELQTPDGTPLEGYSSAQYSGTAGEAEELRHTEFHFSRGELPEEFLAVCTVEPAGPAGEAENRAPAVDGAGEPAEGEAVALTFPIQLDRDKMAGPKTVVVDTWVEADGQRLKVDQLEAYPTHTEIHLQEDPENTCWLAGAEFAFVDGNGKEYDTGDGYITATGGEDSRSMLHYYRQSLYFLEGQEMTLSIRRLKWLDKEQEWADIDLAAGTACGLPEGTELLQVCREGDRTILLFRQAEGGPDAPFTFLFRDPEGTEHTFDGVTTSGTAEEVDGRKHVEYLYHIQNCAWDRIQIQLAHTETADHEDLNIPFVLP